MWCPTGRLNAFEWMWLFSDEDLTDPRAFLRYAGLMYRLREYAIKLAALLEGTEFLAQDDAEGGEQSVDVEEGDGEEGSDETGNDEGEDSYQTETEDTTPEEVDDEYEDLNYEEDAIWSTKAQRILQRENLTVRGRVRAPPPPPHPNKLSR